jgi:Flp pilus assembly protein TadB
MPLSDHEQRILDEIERRLAEEDPRLVESVSRTSLTIHLLRRIRWSLLAFFAGFFMLMLLFVSIWIAVAGFAVMVTSAMLVYHYLKQMGKDQLRTLERGGRLSLTAALARWTERFRRQPPGGRDS